VPYVVDRRDIGEVWNPGSRAGHRTPLFGPGRASYWVDDDHMVQLDWQPKTGIPQHTCGPIPELAIQGTSADRRKRHLLRLVVLVYCAYPIIAAIGFVVGYVVSNGPHGHRMVVGLDCTALAVVGYMFLGPLVTIGWSVFRRSSVTKAPAP
jgi:hypothetical protein